jgi:hypothetical protein
MEIRYFQVLFFRNIPVILGKFVYKSANLVISFFITAKTPLFG